MKKLLCFFKIVTDVTMSPLGEDLHIWRCEEGQGKGGQGKKEGQGKTKTQLVQGEHTHE